MNWIQERAKQTKELRNHAEDLQKRLDLAMDSLEQLSTGHGLHEKDRAPALGMGMLASARLNQIGKMQFRSKPFIYWT